MPPTGHGDPNGPIGASGDSGGDPVGTPRDPSGRRRLTVAVVAGLALVATLVGLQLVDEGDGPARHGAPGGATSSAPGR